MFNQVGDLLKLGKGGVWVVQDKDLEHLLQVLLEVVTIGVDAVVEDLPEVSKVDIFLIH